MEHIGQLALAVLGGVTPTLAWLWFWLREDSEHPEPRRLITLAFVGGMLSVFLAIILEQYAAQYFIAGPSTYTAWSSIEEMVKFAVALSLVLWRHEDDEPIDAVIYMVTVALGFAAMENTLFLLNPDTAAHISSTLVMTNLRFIGATLVHVLSSAAIGVFLAVSFYSTREDKWLHGIIGVIVASALHATFNFFILNAAENEILKVFLFVWIGIIALLGTLEYVKRIAPIKNVLS